MIELSISVEMIDRAKMKADNLGILNNSIRKGKGNFVGFLGEEVVANYLGVKTSNTFDYDLLYHGKTIDVKTKECSTPPRPYYDCSISGSNTFQKCDQYIFVRILSDYSKAWILGKKDKQDFFKSAKFHKKGELDPDNNFVFRWDCYNMPISNLDQL